MAKAVDDETYPPEEAERRSDELLRHMLNRPPQPRTTPTKNHRNRKPTGGRRAALKGDRPEKS